MYAHYWGKLTEINLLEDIHIDWGKYYNCSSSKQDGVAQTGLIWRRKMTRSGLS
jgi:hypothetical protein